jgi:hypothetical protein
MKYHGDIKEVAQGMIDHHLKADDALFDGSKYTIIISTAAVINLRNGPAAQSKWRRKEQGMTKKDADAVYNDLDPAYPGSLKFCFDVVGIDEAHVVKTKSTAAHVGMIWLKARFFLLLTGTPDLNSYADIEGLSKFCLAKSVKGSGGNSWSDAGLSRLHVEKTVNPYALDDHEDAAKFLRPTEYAIKQYILKPSLTPIERGRNLAAYYQSVMIRRTIVSKVDGREVERDIATISQKQISCEFTETERKVYEEVAARSTKRLIKINPKTKRPHWSGKHARLLQLYQFWTGFRQIHKYMKAKDMQGLLARENPLHHIVSMYCNATGKAIPDITDIEGQLTIVCEGSPKMRFMLHTVANVNVIDGKKMLLVASRPAQQVLVAAVLRALQINCAAYHAGLTAEEKYAIQNAFNKSPNPTIIVGTFLTLSYGGNWHSRCHTGLCLDPALSLAIYNQIKGRLQRIGQRSAIMFMTLYTTGTINDRTFQKTLRKGFPGTLAMMNEAVFGHEHDESGETKDRSKLDTYAMVQYRGKMVRADEAEVAGLDLPVLTSIEVVQQLMLNMLGASMSWDRPDNTEDLAAVTTNMGSEDSEVPGAGEELRGLDEDEEDSGEDDSGEEDSGEEEADEGDSGADSDDS